MQQTPLLAIKHIFRYTEEGRKSISIYSHCALPMPNFSLRKAAHISLTISGERKKGSAASSTPRAPSSLSPPLSLSLSLPERSVRADDIDVSHGNFTWRQLRTGYSELETTKTWCNVALQHMLLVTPNWPQRGVRDGLH
jgi:hypothetical protein